jgi:hypothetical protein
MTFEQAVEYALEGENSGAADPPTSPRSGA